MAQSVPPDTQMPYNPFPHCQLPYPVVNPDSPHFRYTDGALVLPLPLETVFISFHSRYLYQRATKSPPRPQRWYLEKQHKTPSQNSCMLHGGRWGLLPPTSAYVQPGISMERSTSHPLQSVCIKIHLFVNFFCTAQTRQMFGGCRGWGRERQRTRLTPKQARPSCWGRECPQIGTVGKQT